MARRSSCVKPSEENMAQLCCCCATRGTSDPGDLLGPHSSFNVRRWKANLPTVRIGCLFNIAHSDQITVSAAFLRALVCLSATKSILFPHHREPMRRMLEVSFFAQTSPSPK